MEQSLKQIYVDYVQRACPNIDGLTTVTGIGKSALLVVNRMSGVFSTNVDRIVYRLSSQM